jgi:hypothetical protein
MLVLFHYKNIFNLHLCYFHLCYLVSQATGFKSQLFEHQRKWQYTVVCTWKSVVGVKYQKCHCHQKSVKCWQLFDKVGMGARIDKKKV